MQGHLLKIIKNFKRVTQSTKPCSTAWVVHTCVGNTHTCMGDTHTCMGYTDLHGLQSHKASHRATGAGELAIKVPRLARDHHTDEISGATVSQCYPNADFVITVGLIQSERPRECFLRNT